MLPAMLMAWPLLSMMPVPVIVTPRVAGEVMAPVARRVPPLKMSVLVALPLPSEPVAAALQNARADRGGAGVGVGGAGEDLGARPGLGESHARSSVGYYAAIGDGNTRLRVEREGGDVAGVAAEHSGKVAGRAAKAAESQGGDAAESAGAARGDQRAVLERKGVGQG